MSEQGSSYMPATSVSFSATPAFVRAFGADEAAAQQQNFEKPSWHKTAPVDVPPPSYQQAKGPPPSAPAPSTSDNPLISANEDTGYKFEAFMVVACILLIGGVIGFVVHGVTNSMRQC